jgi:hypothetical protein
MPEQFNEIIDRVRTGLRNNDAEALEEANRRMRVHGFTPGTANFAELSRRLEQEHLLPGLLLVESPHIDGTQPGGDGARGGRMDGQLSRAELEAASRNRNSPLTALAAGYGSEHFREINDARGISFFGGALDRRELERHVNAAGERPVERAQVQNRENEERAQEARRQEALARGGSDYGPPAPGQREATINNCRTILSNPEATATEKLQAAETLARNGVTGIRVNLNGQEINLRIGYAPVAPNSDRHYVHIFSNDGRGHEHILLRGVSRNGEIAQQRTPQGQAGYVGNWWSRNNVAPEFTGVNRGHS